MPQALAFAGAYIASNAAAAIGASVATQAAVASFAAAVTPALVIAGGSIALSAVLRPDVPTLPPPSDGQEEFSQPIPPRMFHYGRVKVSGPLAFFEDTVADGNVVAKIILLSSRRIDAIEEHYLDDARVITDAVTAEVTNKYIEGGASYAKLQMRLGENPQDAFPILITTFPDIWTSAHRLNDIACVATWFNDTEPDQQLQTYPNHIPTYKAKLRGVKLYDPRDSSQTPTDVGTHIWSDNPALAILDWLTHADGFGIPLAEIDVPSFSAMANVCDGLVPLAIGVSERRYRVSTTAFLTEPRKDVLTRLRNSCDARLYSTSEGKIAIRGGAWTAPTVSLSTNFPEAGILEAQFTNGPPAMARYNELSVRCLSPDHDFVEVEAEPWVNQTDIDAYGLVTQSLDLPQVPSLTQARRLAKIAMARDNARWAGSIATNLTGLNALDQETITLTSDELHGGPDAFNGSFWIDGDITIDEALTGIRMGVRRADSASFNWTTAEEGTRPAIPPDEKLPFTAGVAPDPVTGVNAVGGVKKATITWTAPVDEEFAAARVWRSETASFADAIDVSGPITMPLEENGDPSLTTMTFIDPVKAGTYRYWVTAESTVGDGGPSGTVAMAPVGPNGAIVTSS